MTKQQALHELKHSIQTHVMILNGTTPTLSTFLIKLIDCLEDDDENRVIADILNLSYVIVEHMAIYIQQSLDMRDQKNELPSRVKQKRDDILVTIGKCKSLKDKVAAKNAVLSAASKAIRELGVHTRSKYPAITDSKRQPL